MDKNGNFGKKKLSIGIGYDTRDFGGRLCTLVDPAGGRTEVAYGDHGAEESTTDAVGRVISTVYDNLGLKAGATLPDGSSW